MLQLNIYFKFAFASSYKKFRLAATPKSLTHYTKGTLFQNITALEYSISSSISHIVNIFSSFLHSTSTLSVIKSYLGLEGGPPIFKQTKQKLFYSLKQKTNTYTGLTPSLVHFSSVFLDQFNVKKACSAFTHHY